MPPSERNIEVNGRRYAWPPAPVIAVRVDGSEPDDIAQARWAGVTPWLDRVLSRGGAPTGDRVVPSFINPNDVLIVTRIAPAVHGTYGNYFHDVTTACEVPLLFNRTQPGIAPGRRLQNSDVFDLALNRAPAGS